MRGNCLLTCLMLGLLAGCGGRSDLVDTDASAASLDTGVGEIDVGQPPPQVDASVPVDAAALPQVDASMPVDAELPAPVDAGAACPPSCDDDNPCTEDFCDTSGACQHYPLADGTACGPSTPCQETAVCQSGVCATGASVDCDDGAPCTSDSCDPATGCEHTLDTDGTSCGTGLYCWGGICNSCAPGDSCVSWHETPVAGVLTLHRAWGTASDDVWAIGTLSSGPDSAIHWDGHQWTPMELSKKALWLEGIWGSSSTDVWAVGSSTSADGFYSAEDIRHWDGQSWTRVKAPQDDGFDLSGVWGSSDSDVWAVGGDGTISFRGAIILHWNGSAWSTYAQSRSYGYALSALWGTSSSDVWAVGTNGSIAHYSGKKQWSSLTPITKESLTSIWGSGPNDAWAVGTAGTILHWDGNAWSLVASGVKDDLYGVWGTRSDDVWIAGPFEALLHWDGSAWSPVKVANLSNWAMQGGWSASQDDSWAVGSTILHFGP